MHREGEMSNETTAIAVVDSTGESIQQLSERMDFEAARIAKMQMFVKAHMVKDTDYGVIPGAGKKSVLLKPGAEVMCGIYRLAPEYDIKESYEPERNKNWTKDEKKWNPQYQKMTKTGKVITGTSEGRYEVSVTCTLRHMGSGVIVGQGVGSCNSWETKYLTESIDDTKNTVLKMAKKRAYVDATLSACRLSAFFTQDIETAPEEHQPARPMTQAAPPDEPPHPAEVEVPAPPKAKAKAAPKGKPADSGQTPEAALGLDPCEVGQVESVIQKPTSTGGKRYRIVMVGGKQFFTFDAKLAQKAQDAMTAQAQVEIIYAMGQYGADVKVLTVLNEEAA